jgi:hypothetical protein
MSYRNDVLEAGDLRSADDGTHHDMTPFADLLLEPKPLLVPSLPLPSADDVRLAGEDHEVLEVRK